MSTKIRWAVLLCKCKGVADRNDIKQYFVNFFTEGLFGAVDYWHDISFLELDLRESAVFGWFELPVTSEEIKRTRRSDAINMAINTATNSNNGIADFNPKIVFISEPFIGMNITEGGQQGAGSSGGQVIIDLGVLRASFILHEMGHGHGLNHSLFLDGTHYGSPYCLMSAEQYGNTDPRYNDPRFGLSGPRLCSPYTYKAGWLPELNLIRIQCNGKRPLPTTCILPTFRFNDSVVPQVAVIDFDTPQKLSYFIEYRRADAKDGWDRGLQQDAIAIHQWRPDGFAYYVGKIGTSTVFNGNPFGDGTVVPAEKIYIDAKFDLSIEVISVSDSDGTIEIRIAPAAAVQTLSVLKITKEKLGIMPEFSIKNQVLQNGRKSLRDSLVELLA